MEGGEQRACSAPLAEFCRLGEPPPPPLRLPKGEPPLPLVNELSSPLSSAPSSAAKEFLAWILSNARFIVSSTSCLRGARHTRRRPCLGSLPCGHAVGAPSSTGRVGHLQLAVVPLLVVVLRVPLGP